MSWQSQLRGDSVSWLLEKDMPNVRYLALHDLVDDGKTSDEQRRARKAAYANGPIPRILGKMSKEGYWVKPGAGYTQKYRSGVWSLLMLAQLGASAKDDVRIQRACTYLLDHGMAPGGQITTTTSGAPSGTVDCLQGNMCWSLLELGCDDPRLAQAFDWMARSQTGEGLAPSTDRNAVSRYFAYKCGPDFACGANGGHPCAWGAVKVMLAFGKLPKSRRTPLIERAIQRGLDFLFSVDPADATYPTRTGAKTSRDWWKFGFPLFYVTDLLQIVEALVALGYGRDPRLSRALQLIRDKQDADGRWSLDYNYTAKTWVTFGPKRQPNKWVTLRALRVLKAVGG
jgi:hypothetical protein